MPDTRPGLTFTDGVCQACLNYENRKNIDWGVRFSELARLCGKHCKNNGHDCVIAVSGGKDSHFQVHVIKEQMGMNPLLVTVEDNFPMTRAGEHNIKNISEEFGCEIISLKPDIKTQKEIGRKTFEEFGKPTWYIDRLIYTYPIYIAEKFGIPLVVYGENVSYEYGGEHSEDTYSAKEQILNGVLDDVSVGTDVPLISAGILSNGLEQIYLSYFVPWNSYENYVFAKSRGFKDLSGEWKRTHHIENYDQIDSRAYLVHPWLKYPKYGHASATDIASRLIRYGIVTREEGIKLVKGHDHRLDQKCVDDFCDFFGYDENEFWFIVDTFYDRKIFELNDMAEWVLKEPIK